jgi:hypothetical protein
MQQPKKNIDTGLAAATLSDPIYRDGEVATLLWL